MVCVETGWLIAIVLVILGFVSYRITFTSNVPQLGLCLEGVDSDGLRKAIAFSA